MASLLGQWWHGDHMDGGWWWVMGIGWLVFLGVLATLGYLLVRHLTQGGGSAPPRSGNAEAILAERFARGEIDDDEYYQRLAVIRRSH